MPKAFVAALVIICLIDFNVFAHAWQFGSWNTIVMHHKKNVLAQPESADIVFMGDSTLMALDASALHEEVRSDLKFYNFYLNNMYVNHYMSLTTRQYLERKKTPRAIVLSFLPRYFYLKDRMMFPVERSSQYFRRFVPFPLFVSTLPFAEGDSLKEAWKVFSRSLRLASDYIINFFPSYDYRGILKGCLPAYIRINSSSVDETANQYPSVRSALNGFKLNQSFMEHLKNSSGQFLITAEQGRKGEPGLTDLEGVDTTRVHNHDIEKIIQLAEEAGIPVVFFFMPYWDKRSEALGRDRYFGPVVYYLQELDRQHDNFFFRPMPDFFYTGENFFDDMHLNVKGTERFNKEFTRHLESVLAEIGV